MLEMVFTVRTRLEKGIAAAEKARKSYFNNSDRPLTVLLGKNMANIKCLSMISLLQKPKQWEGLA